MVELLSYARKFSTADIEIFHTYPVDDWHPHDTYEGAWDICPCGPEVIRYNNGNVQIVHNAWDGRE